MSGRCAAVERPVLAIDCCGAIASLALGRYVEGRLEVLNQLSLAARTAGAQLTSGLAQLLGAHAPAELGAIVIVRGPGSFTGMRISLSAAKALAEATQVPVVALSRLALLLAVHGGAAALLDAGRGHVYLREAAGDYECMLSAEQARARLGDGPAGTTVSRLPQTVLCEDKVAVVFREARRVPEPNAVDALRAARTRVAAGAWEDVATLDALYLWRAEQMFGGAVRAS